MLLIVRADLVPRAAPKTSRKPPWQTERDVHDGLRALGYDVRLLAVDDDARPIADALRDWRPGVVFNLLPDFAIITSSSRTS